MYWEQFYINVSLMFYCDTCAFGKKIRRLLTKSCMCTCFNLITNYIKSPYSYFNNKFSIDEVRHLIYNKMHYTKMHSNSL